MVKQVSAILLIIISVFCCSCSGNARTPLPAGSRAPFTKFLLLDGSYRLTDELRGHPTLIVFWAAWCSRSRSEMQKLVALAAQEADPPRILAVSLDDFADEKKLQAAIQTMHLETFEHAFSGNAGGDEAYLHFGADVLPHFFALDAAGMLIGNAHAAREALQFFKPE